MADSGSFKDVIALSDDATAKFGKAVETSEKKMLSDVVTMLKDLEITKKGNIATTPANLKKMMNIRSKLYKLANNKEYLEAVKELISTFDKLFKKQIGVLALADKIGRSDEKYKLTKQIAIENTIAALSGDGLAANVTNKLNEMLLTAVTTGAKFSDLQDQMYEYLRDTDNGSGALSRYAKTWSVTAMSQYTGQVNKLATDDLDYAWFMYVGSNIETTREFCQHVTKKRYVHVTELPDLLKGHVFYDGEDHECGIYDKTGLPYGMIEGTTVENLQVNCGGWNCRHQLVPVADEVVPADVRARIQEKLDSMVKSVDLGPYKDRIEAVQDYVNTHKSAKVSKFLFDSLEAAQSGDKKTFLANLESAEKTIEINEASIKSKAKKRAEAKSDFAKWQNDHGSELSAIKSDINRCDVGAYMDILTKDGHKYNEYEEAFKEIKAIIKLAKDSHAFVYKNLKGEIDNAVSLGYDALAKSARTHLRAFDSYTSNKDRADSIRDMGDTASAIKQAIDVMNKTNGTGIDADKLKSYFDAGDFAKVKSEVKRLEKLIEKAASTVGKKAISVTGSANTYVHDSKKLHDLDRLVNFKNALLLYAGKSGDAGVYSSAVDWARKGLDSLLLYKAKKQDAYCELDLDIINQHAELMKADLSVIPTVYVGRFNDLVSKINATDFSEYGYVSCKSEIREAYNIYKLSTSKTAVKYGLDKISTKMPVEIVENFKKIFNGGEMPDKDFFDMMDVYVPLIPKTVNGSEGFYSPLYKVVVISPTASDANRLNASEWFRRGLFYHEYGHAKDNIAEKGKWASDARWGALFDKYSKIINAGGGSAIRATFDKKYADLGGRYGISRDDLEILGALADTLQSMIKGHNYFDHYGHPVNYYSNRSMQLAEFIAHASENRWIGNKYFQELMPDLYKEMIDLCNEMYK